MLKLLKLLLVMLLLTSCQSETEETNTEKSNTSTEKIDFASCMENLFCEEAVIKQFDSAQDYEQLEGLRLSPHRPWLAIDRARYWPYLLETSDCSVLTDKPYQLECEYAKTHVAKTLAECLTLPASQAASVHHNSRHSSTYYNQPQLYCISMLVDQMDDPQSCLSDDLTPEMQFHCIVQFAHLNVDVSACDLVVDSEDKARCKVEIGIISATGFSHCVAAADKNCFSFTIAKARLLGRSVGDNADLSCATAPDESRASCQQMVERWHDMANGNVAGCDDRSCLDYTAQYIAYYHGDDFDTAKDVIAKCKMLNNAAVNEAACVEELSENLAFMKKDIRWCPDGNNQFRYTCSDLLIDYLQPQTPIDCNTAGSIHGGETQQLAEANCLAASQIQQAKVAQDFEICAGDIMCEEHLALYLEQNHQFDPEPCKTHSNSEKAEKCVDRLSNLHAAKTGLVQFCQRDSCLDEALETNPAADCGLISDSAFKVECQERQRFVNEKATLTIKGCAAYASTEDCLDRLVTYHIEAETTEKLNPAECESFDQTSQQCFDLLARELVAPDLCRGDYCYRSSVKEVVEKGLLEQNFCARPLAEDNCTERYNHALARIAHRIENCRDDYCYEAIINSARSGKLNRFYLHSLGISDDMLKPYFSHFYDWNPEFGDSIELTLDVQQFIAASRSDKNAELLSQIYPMLQLDSKACESIPAGEDFWDKPYPLSCKQQVSSYTAMLTNNYQLCGTRDCLDSFIESNVLNSSEQCDLLNQTFTDRTNREALSQECRELMAAASND